MMKKSVEESSGEGNHDRRKPRYRLLFRVLKWSVGILLTVILVVAICLAGGVAYYRSIVRSQPGGLETDFRPEGLLSEVDPFIGTGGVPWVCAYNSPCACQPFGLVRLAPDTESFLFGIPALNASGYYYGDNRIVGFSHTRLLGADALDGGNFRFFPTVRSRIDRHRKDGPNTRFSHEEETAFPGYYAVRLPSEKALVELTATPRVGIHRYTFGEGEAPHLLVDITSSLGDLRTEDGCVKILPASREIEGSVKSFGTFAQRYGGLELFFVAHFSRPFSHFEVWKGTETSTETEVSGEEDLTVHLAFEEGGTNGPSSRFEVRVALSSVSIENARENLREETQGRSFGEIVRAAGKNWEEKLSRIRIQGGTPRERRIFYTSLYRTFQMPTRFNDIDGEYLGFDKTVHVADGFEYYTDFSLWDTFRTVHPLYNLIARSEQRDMLVSLVEMAKAGGAFPRWAQGGGYTNAMQGTPAHIAIPEAYLKGIDDFDVETAYSIMRRTALEGTPAGSRFAGRKGLEDYLKLGYCPSEKMKKAVARTLEFSHADYSLALLAEALGYDDDRDRFLENAKSYRNLWNPETRYFQPRDSTGEFQPIDPLLLTYTEGEGELTNDYVEGSALQWRYAIPFDPEGLIGLFEEPGVFVRELETFFEGSTPNIANWNPGPYYWHGNEPYIHTVYLFNTAGRPDLTQKWVRWIFDRKYTDDYIGLDGNDDGGTLSAWYVLSSLGFYPIAGTTRYEIGAPLFEEAVLQMGEGTLHVIATNLSPRNRYVQSVKLNGAIWKKTWFDHADISEGGTLEFEMGAEPPRQSFSDSSPQQGEPGNGNG